MGIKILKLLRAVWILLLCILNLAVCSLMLYLLGFFKLLAWKTPISHSLERGIEGIIIIWIKINNMIMRLFIPTILDIRGEYDFSRKQSYLLVSNHQSWVDILLLERIFVDKLPPMKFFMKKELLWVPFLGLACKIAGFPFMRRYTRDYLVRNPEGYGRDLAVARRACQRFKKSPATIINFSEGTRFRPEKWERQQSPYHYLLRPRAGGIALVINVMGDMLEEMVDVTISYPSQSVSLWNFLKGEYPIITILIQKRTVPKQLSGDYNGDPEFRAFFQNWLNEIWQEKDKNVANLMRDQH